MLKTGRHIAIVTCLLLIAGFAVLGAAIHHQQGQMIDRIALAQHTEALLSTTNEASILAKQAANKRTFENFQTASANHLYNATDKISAELVQREIEPEITEVAENILDANDKLLEVLAGLQQSPDENELKEFSEQLAGLAKEYESYEATL